MPVPETDPRFFGIVRIGSSSLGLRLDRLSEVCHVDKLDVLPLKSGSLLGGFDLRGSIVPVLDISQILGLQPQAAATPLCVVIKREERVLAFYVDEVLDIAKTEVDNAQMLSGPDPETNKFYKGVFRHNDQFVSIIDVTSLFDLPGVFSASKPEMSNQKTLDQKTPPMLVFEAGHALFALPALEVYAAVPRQSITQSAISVGPCLGEISYYDRRVPIICPIEVFGLGTEREPGPCEIVVVRAPGERLIGFAVDAIRNIESFAAKNVVPVPDRANSGGLISGVNILGDGRQVYILEVEALHKNPMLSEIAGLSSAPPKQTAVETERSASDKPRNVVHEKERYLVVDAGRQLAIPLTQVTCIVDPPRQVTPARSDKPGFEGYFSWLGKTVTLIDLAGFMGKTGKHGRERRIVLTGPAEDKIGFGVDRILSIEVSNWRETPNADGMGAGLPAVQLGGPETKTVLPVLDLEAAVQSGRV